MTDHAVSRKPADDPAFRLPKTLGVLTLPLCVGGLIALIVGWLIGLYSVDMTFAMSSYLTALMYCITIALGCGFFVVIQHLCRAGWSAVVRRVAELLMVMIIPLAILFLPVVFATWGETLYDWSEPGYGESHGIPSEVWSEKLRWLDPSWFTARSIAYVAVWSLLGAWYFRLSRLQDATGEVAITERLQFWSGPAVILFSLCTTFAAFDWMMSLAPMWFSTMFGVYIFTGGILAAHCAIAAFSYVLQRTGAMRDEVSVEHYHDLGKLIFGFVCFWGYIAFSQYMLIWYGNIPEETHWFYTRQLGPWAAVSLSLIFLHWGVPFFGTMSRHVRRRPGLVCFWSIFILVMHFIDIYWIVMPEAGPEVGLGGAGGIASSVLCGLGMLALMLGLMLRVAGQTTVVAVRDPRLGESLAFENV